MFKLITVSRLHNRMKSLYGEALFRSYELSSDFLTVSPLYFTTRRVHVFILPTPGNFAFQKSGVYNEI